MTDTRPPGRQQADAEPCHDQAQHAIASLRRAICQVLPCREDELAEALDLVDYGTVDDGSIHCAVHDLIADKEIVEVDGVLRIRS